jgi:two-component system, OmpR family, sensor histidine kinase KdpD
MRLGKAANFTTGSSLLLPTLLALALVAGMTLCLLAVTRFVELHHVSSAYLIPVLIAAIRLGIVPAIVAAVGGVAASAFFFYPPIFDFRVENPEQILDLPLFVIVAAVTGQLAARARAHAVLAQDREGEMRALYAFSKRLAVATDPAQIYSAIRDHLDANTGCRVVYFEAGASLSASHREANNLPDSVLRAVSKFA